MACTEMRGTFGTGRWNVGVEFLERLIRTCVFAAMGNGALVDRVKSNSTRNRPQMLLKGVPSRR